ncbi:MAG: ATP synthase gamma chain [candidate division BRC1 bacterium ADurb.BinA364]|nr:MAG: ATP synthase gamma chain [candidate division BRC1 bacterium ADurb.BinA364]
MAENLKLLRRRIRSVANTQKITRAMEMVSAAKLRRAQGVLRAGRPYADKLQALLGRLASAAAVEGNPLFERRDAQKAILVVFTADRGLCGSFNTNIISAAERWAAQRGREGLELYCVGKKGRAYFAKRNWPIAGTMEDFGGSIDAQRSNALSAELQARFLSRQADEVFLLYSAFVSSSTFRPTVARFLSLQPESLLERESAASGAAGATEYIFEPSAAELFEALLPRYLQSKIYITFAEQFTSEHSARMLAMHNATNNCEEVVANMTLRMNKARQAAITKELLDIVGGAEAIAK